MIRDGVNRIAVVPLSVPAAALTATRTSQILDLQGFDSVAIIFDIGALTGSDATTNYLSLKLQESDTIVGASFTDVATTNTNIPLGGIVGDYPRNGSPVAIIGTGSTTLPSNSYKLGYIGTKRYIRAVITVTGTISAGVASITAILERGNYAPPTAPAAITAT